MNKFFVLTFTFTDKTNLYHSHGCDVPVSWLCKHSEPYEDTNFVQTYVSFTL